MANKLLLAAFGLLGVAFFAVVGSTLYAMGKPFEHLPPTPRAASFIERNGITKPYCERKYGDERCDGIKNGRSVAIVCWGGGCFWSKE